MAKKSTEGEKWAIQAFGCINSTWLSKPKIMGIYTRGAMRIFSSVPGPTDVYYMFFFPSRSPRVYVTDKPMGFPHITFQRQSRKAYLVSFCFTSRWLNPSENRANKKRGRGSGERESVATSHKSDQKPRGFLRDSPSSNEGNDEKKRVRYES